MVVSSSNQCTTQLAALRSRPSTSRMACKAPTTRTTSRTVTTAVQATTPTTPRLLTAPHHPTTQTPSALSHHQRINSTSRLRRTSTRTSSPQQRRHMASTEQRDSPAYHQVGSRRLRHPVRHPARTTALSRLANIRVGRVDTLAIPEELATTVQRQILGLAWGLGNECGLRIAQFGGVHGAFECLDAYAQMSGGRFAKWLA